MKKSIVAMLAVVLLMSGCSTKVKGDKTMVCILSSEYEEETFFGYVEVDYDSETKEAEKANFSYSYDNLRKNERNNDILVDLVNRNSIYTEIEGVTTTIDIKDFSFGYAEAWDFNELDYDAAYEVDLVQKEMMNADKDGYDVDNIKKVFMAQDYSCDMNGTKKEDTKKEDTKKKDTKKESGKKE